MSVVLKDETEWENLISFGSVFQSVGAKKDKEHNTKYLSTPVAMTPPSSPPPCLVLGPVKGDHQPMPPTPERSGGGGSGGWEGGGGGGIYPDTDKPARTHRKNIRRKTTATTTKSSCPASTAINKAGAEELTTSSAHHLRMDTRTAKYGLPPRGIRHRRNREARGVVSLGQVL